MGSLTLENLSLAYQGTLIIKNLSLTVEHGSIVSLLGPSGVGKTTILKAIAGLLKPVSGNILINGEIVNNQLAEERDTVLIFQKPLLFPFLNVSQNIGFGLKMAGVKGKTANNKIKRILDITMLQGLEKRKVHQLSGGQQQRVALARGLVLEPSLLLLDEPLSNLDSELRLQMRELIQQIQLQTATTMLLVTHDQAEALTMSDQICLLLRGSMRQCGPPTELFYRPADEEVAQFFGSSNLLEGSINNGIFEWTDPISPGQQQSRGVIRPEDIVILKEPEQGSYIGKVCSVHFEGALTRLDVVVDQRRFNVFTIRPDFFVGQVIWLQFPIDRIHFLPPP